MNKAQTRSINKPCKDKHKDKNQVSRVNQGNKQLTSEVRDLNMWLLYNLFTRVIWSPPLIASTIKQRWASNVTIIGRWRFPSSLPWAFGLEDGALRGTLMDGSKIRGTTTSVGQVCFPWDLLRMALARILMSSFGTKIKTSQKKLRQQ